VKGAMTTGESIMTHSNTRGGKVVARRTSAAKTICALAVAAVLSACASTPSVSPSNEFSRGGVFAQSNSTKPSSAEVLNESSRASASRDARANVPQSAEARELEKALRDSGLESTVKSFFNEETIGALFGIARVLLSDATNNANNANVKSGEQSNSPNLPTPGAKQKSRSQEKMGESTAVLEKQMEKLGDELPKKLLPLLGKLLDVAESEVKRAAREQAANSRDTSDATKR
jgi:hypothetical protein